MGKTQLASCKTFAFDVNLTLHLSINLFCSWANRGRDHKSDKKLRGLNRFPFVRNCYFQKLLTQILPTFFNRTKPAISR